MGSLESVRLRWPIATLMSSTLAGGGIGALGGFIDRGSWGGRATVIPFGIAAGLVALGAMLPTLFFRPPNLRTGEACLYVGATAGTVSTALSYYWILASRYHLTGWRLYLEKPIFHSIAILVFWFAVAFGAGYGLQGLHKRAAKGTSA